MFIENVRFSTNMTDINKIRYLLFTNFYNNSMYIEQLKEIINRHIECISVEYSSSDYTFTIKIKKTAMRKLPGFVHNPNYYYHTIPNIFKEFISNNKQSILHVLRMMYNDPSQVLEQIYDNHFIMANLCHTTCIADNIVVIKL